MLANMPTTFIAADLKNALRHCQPCISTDKTRYYIGGVYMHASADGNATHFVATDGRRLCLRTLEVQYTLGAGVIIPRAAVADIIKALPTKACHGSAEVRFEKSENDINVYLPDGAMIPFTPIYDPFPEYRRVIPLNNPHEAVLNAEAFTNCVVAIHGFLKSSDAVTMKLSFAEVENALTFTASVRINTNWRYELEGNAAVKMKADKIGAAIDIGFNAQYLLDYAKQVSFAVIIKYADSGSPTVFRSSADGPDDVFVLMPMRISHETNPQS